ncbi:hypothetical protein HDR58_02135 [bacterium]|nr:hypothetical protein [bacterium]
MNIPKINNFQQNSQNFTSIKLVKPEFTELNGVQIIKPIRIESALHSNPIDVVVQNYIKSNKKSFFTSILEPKNSIPIANHTYYIDKRKGIFKGSYLETNYYNRNKGYAELMRLVSIILMKENNLKTNNITAKFEAVPFHMKYNFNIDGIETVQKYQNWTSITDALERFQLWIGDLFDKQTKQEIKADSNDLLKRISKSENSKQLEIDVCKFIEKFYKNTGTQAQTIAENINYYSWVSHIFMSLKMQDIMNNSTKFNELFLKHGIAYKL